MLNFHMLENTSEVIQSDFGEYAHESGVIPVNKLHIRSKCQPSQVKGNFSELRVSMAPAFPTEMLHTLILKGLPRPSMTLFAAVAI